MTAGRQGEGFTLPSAVVIWGHTVPGVSGHWFLLVVFCLSVHRSSLSLCIHLSPYLIFIYFYFSVFPFNSLLCLFLSVFISLCLSPFTPRLSSFCSSHPSPRALSPGPRGVPPVGEAARPGRARLCQGPSPHLLPEHGKVALSALPGVGACDFICLWI